MRQNEVSKTRESTHKVAMLPLTFIAKLMHFENALHKKTRKVKTRKENDEKTRSTLAFILNLKKKQNLLKLALFES